MVNVPTKFHSGEFSTFGDIQGKLHGLHMQERILAHVHVFVIQSTTVYTWNGIIRSTVHIYAPLGPVSDQKRVLFTEAEKEIEPWPLGSKDVSPKTSNASLTAGTANIPIMDVLAVGIGLIVGSSISEVFPSPEKHGMLSKFQRVKFTPLE